MISNSGHDENGKYSGGKAGDQTGGEWTIQKWYNRPWTVVLRHTRETVGQLIAELAREAAENNLIGYDQGDRYTFWQKLKDAGYHPKNITDACEADCSAGVAAICKAAGYLLNDEMLKAVSIYAYTGNLRQVLTAAGFTVITDPNYLKSDAWLKAGDVLLYEGHHTTINLTDGEKVKPTSWYPSDIVTGKLGLEVLTDLTVRSGPGTAYQEVKTLARGKHVLADQKAFVNGVAWLHIKDGWISGRYVEGWLQEPNGRWWYVEAGYSYPAYSLKKIGGKDYAFDADGWNISADRIAADNSIID